MTRGGTTPGAAGSTTPGAADGTTPGGVGPVARATGRHFGWSAGHAPCLSVAPGASVEFVLDDPSDGQLGPRAVTADLDDLDWERVPPLAGPVEVEGAEPGDALRITVEDIELGSWGWTAVLPDFGLLADEFPDPALKIWTLEPGATAAEFAPGVRVPLKPFPGEIGVAPAAAGVHPALPPGSFGGNLDTRDLAVGSVLLLPVQVPGALLSCGDGHAAQGDGEVCGTAIEAPMTVRLRLDLVKDTPLAGPRFTTPGPVTRHLDAAGYEVTMGVGPDLMEAARTAVNEAIASLTATRGLSRPDAYMLCSVCGDLRITEIVDAPNWVVAFYLPRSAFV